MSVQLTARENPVRVGLLRGVRLSMKGERGEYPEGSVLLVPQSVYMEFCRQAPGAAMNITSSIMSVSVKIALQNWHLRKLLTM